MLRPNFVRSQVGDVLTFERHVSHLISKLPSDGKTPVNLADYFFRLTLAQTPSPARARNPSARPSIADR
jgi:hypothetical protein